MIDIKPSKMWIFTVDTDEYAGNFEREMVAYMTGRYGECCVGSTEAARFNVEMNRDDVIDPWVEDDHPFAFVRSMPDEKGCCRPVTIGPTPQGRLTDLVMKRRGRPLNSVGIFMERPPTKNEIELLKERAQAFSEYWAEKCSLRKKILIQGFRLLTTEVVVTEEAI